MQEVRRLAIVCDIPFSHIQTLHSVLDLESFRKRASSEHGVQKSLFGENGAGEIVPIASVEDHFPCQSTTLAWKCQKQETKSASRPENLNMLFKELL